MSKMAAMTLLAIASAIAVLPVAALALDYPHASTGCTTCHPAHGPGPWDHPPQDIDDTYSNNLCWYCHNDLIAPRVSTHSSLTTDARYGEWTVECKVCHQAHGQEQFRTYGSASYLFSGVVDAAVSGDPTSSITALGANWTPDAWVGTVVFLLSTPSFSTVIVANSSDTLTLQGPIYAAIQPGSTQFAIVYGRLIRDAISYQKSTAPPTTPISAPVVFFDESGPNSFADGDAVIDGVCEVCHTLTAYHRNDGAGAYHNPGTRCTDCHSHAEGFKASCSGCHGIPPTVDTLGGPSGLVGPSSGQTQPPATGATSAGAHTMHATSAGMGYACGVCHYQGMPTTPVVGNNNLQIGFNIAGAGSGSYDGATLNAPYAYEGTHGTTVTTGGARTCAGIYCHSNGTSVSTGGTPSGTSPAWDFPGPLACDVCHGSPPAYANGQPKANSHTATSHRQPCNVCHYGTTTDGTAITNPANHVNATYEVAPDTSATFNGVPVAFDYAYEVGGGTCSNVSCHGGIALQWGAPQDSVTCTVCHDGVTIPPQFLNHLTIGGTPGPITDSASCKTCHLAGGAMVHRGAPFDIPDGCGQCHWTGAAPYYDETRLAAVTNGIHDSAGVSYPVTFSAAVDAPNSLQVNVDALVDCAGTCPALEYDWEWGDGSAHGAGEVTSHTYAYAGTKSITLTARLQSNHLSVGSATRGVTIPNPDLPPVATSACVWNSNTWTMLVTDASSDDGPDGDALPDASPSLRVNVDWGDSTAKSFGSQGATFTHTYMSGGSFTVTEKAIDDKLQSATTTCPAPATPAYFSISGTVYRRNGITPVPTASVQVRKGSTIVKTVSTATNGTFTTGLILKPGSYTLRVTKSGYTFADPAAAMTVGPSSAGHNINAITP